MELEISDPLEFILKEHKEHQQLCDLLEEIADHLPLNVDKASAQRAAAYLKNQLPLHHRLEEKVLFPLLVKYSAPDDNISDIVERLGEDHVVDESLASELVEILENIVHGSPVKDANMFGYMLRAFFENYRRHISWENSVVIPLAQRRIPEHGLAELSEHMVKMQKQILFGFSSNISLCNGLCDECKSSKSAKSEKLT